MEKRRITSIFGRYLPLKIAGKSICDATMAISNAPLELKVTHIERFMRSGTGKVVYPHNKA